MQNDLEYNSPYWTNRLPFAVKDGLEGLTEKQTKLASYWNTPFSKICLGMKVNNVTKWIQVNHHADSLLKVIANGVFKQTTVGRNKWKSLIEYSYLQSKCNKEGFNFNKVFIKVRIGLVANNENDCKTPDTCIGFGTSVAACSGKVETVVSCGNIFNRCGWSDTNLNITAFGFILVK